MNLESLKSIRNEFVKSDFYRNAQTKMSLSGLSSAEIENYLFNGKKINFSRISEEILISWQKEDSPKTIYRDKSMSILYGIGADDGVEYISIRSNWFGRVKNSQFNLNSFVRNEAFWCGYCAVSDILPMDELSLKKIMGSIVEQKNTNKANLSSAFTCFADYVTYCQKKFGKSPTYEVISSGGYAHAPVIKISITSPQGVFTAEGSSKKVAANEWAKNFKV